MVKGYWVPIAFLIGYMLCAIIAYNFINSSWKEKVIQKGYAEYNQTNAKLQWK